MTVASHDQKRSSWLLRLSAKYPAIPNAIALTGLVAIACVLAPADITAETSGRGTMVETAAIIGPDVAVDLMLQLRAAVNARVPEEVRIWANEIYANPMLYLAIPFLMLLEYLFPCNRTRPLRVRAHAQDVIWFVASAPIKVLIVGAVAVWLRGLYDGHLSFLTIDSAAEWPVPVQLVFGILLGEFLFWLHHMARHKVHALWVFHAVHHSQKELNVFTDDRAHIVDILVHPVATFIPLFMFQAPDLYSVTVVALYRSIHSRFVHANVKLNLGLLGYVLASPQFHRVHHSLDPAHRDTNFGGVLSVFDHLFGTAHPDRDTYPETGISDQGFPTEDKVALWQIPGNWVWQTGYPFAQLLGRLRSLRPKL